LKSKNYIKMLLKKEILILDGAMGTELQKRGLPTGISPELWCLSRPEVCAEIHRAYLAAGSQVIYTCTFGANRAKLNEYNRKDVRQINTSLASLARQVAGKETIVLGDIGPTGKFVEPFGETPFEEAVEIFKEQAAGLLAGGVDGFVIETMMDIQEARAALLAVKELGDYFTAVTITLEKDGRTLNGTDPITALITLQSLGADAVGCNCSAGPAEMIPWITQMKPYSKVPLVAKPNAGLPRITGEGHTFFDMDASTFTHYALLLAEAGANLIGGCCGTTPQHIKALRENIRDLPPRHPWCKSLGAVSSHRSSFVFSEHPALVVIGERINPTGKKELQNALKEESMSVIRNLAKEQEYQGANLLDVNVGMPGTDEKLLLRQAVLAVSQVTSCPLVIDSPNVEAIEQALRIYPGRALVNSISGERKKITELLPIVARYGAMFILLPITDEGVPRLLEERISVIKKVFNAARRFGFSKDDIVVDGLVMTVAAQQEAALETLKTIAWCRQKFHVKTVLGISNVSFGMPERKWINASFLAMARKEGLDMAIINPSSSEVMAIKKATDVLLGHDRGAIEYISTFSGGVAQKKEKGRGPIDLEERVREAIMEGDKEEIISALSELMKQGKNPKQIVDGLMIPAIVEVGDRYSRREFFLPQLLASAETMKKGLAYLEPYLLDAGVESKVKGTVVMATVQGDIHDIGKNIVALMLKNHGYQVVDLGKDVPTKKIIESIRNIKPHVVGLSALMTTTMVVMKEIIQTAREEGLTTPFLLGGAVVSPAYARSLNAYYAKDGVEAVKTVEKLIGKGKSHGGPEKKEAN